MHILYVYELTAHNIRFAWDAYPAVIMILASFLWNKYKRLVILQLYLSLLHSEWRKWYTFFAFLSAIGLQQWLFMYNSGSTSTVLSAWSTELNDMRKTTCVRKSDVSVERILVCYATDNFAEHGTLSVMLVVKMTSYICYRNNYYVILMLSDVIEITICQGIKHTSLSFHSCYVKDLCRHLTYNSRGAWHTTYAMLLLN